ncbi:MAG TPA: glycosyltransferase family 4 protein, partial [Bryobacteraceae bacterium]|nr:glycosyltransferase family 4 protein [Bryobacteraceae bacterium]
NSDVYVLPSLFEGTPLTLMEAMMSGLPVITTSVCGMRDVIKHEVNGLLVEPGSVSDLLAAMQRLLADAEGRARVGRQATSDALTNYTWPAVARIVEQAYFNLLQARN